VTLGSPEVAECWALPTIGEAVEWLKDQAIRHYPGSDLAQKYSGGFA